MNRTEDIWKNHHQKLLGFIRSRVSENDAEDILQNVFIKVHKKMETLNEKTKVESWLFQITRNAVIDHYRMKKPVDKMPDCLEPEQPGHELSAAKELSACLEPFIDELPEKYRTPVMLSDIDGKTQKEVAEQEGLSLSGAKSRIQRGRKLLKEMLNDCCRIEINNHKQVVSYQCRNNEECC